MIEPLLDKIIKIKVLTHHDVESHKMHRRYENEENVLKRMFFLQEYLAIRRYEKKYCLKYDSNIAVSDMDKNRLKEIDERINVIVVQNGVDCEYFKYHPRDEMSKELIFTGALDYYPNAKAMMHFCRQDMAHPEKQISGIDVDDYREKSPGTTSIPWQG